MIVLQRFLLVHLQHVQKHSPLEEINMKRPLGCAQMSKDCGGYINCWAKFDSVGNSVEIHQSNGEGL